MHARRTTLSALLVATSWVLPPPAIAQTFTFERSFPATALTTVDVVTERGRITVQADSGPDVVVRGRVSVRRGWNIPSNAVALARTTAADPPVEQRDDLVRLRMPEDEPSRRAMTIAYEVRVPASVQVVTRSDSGETRVEGVLGRVSVKTQSAAVRLSDLAETDVESGSGAVSVQGAGPLRVRTSSSGIDLTRVSGDLHVRTESGRVSASMAEEADVDVVTGSSEITIDGLGGALVVSTRSGRVRVSGNPRRPWEIVTGSSAIETRFSPAAALTVEARSDSGSVEVKNLWIDGESGKGYVSGTIQGGGATTRLRSRSGSITLRGYN